MPRIYPERPVMDRLHRAAQEIENSARSRSRQPSQLARYSCGAGLSWPFNGGDLFAALDRAGLAVIEKPRP